MKIISTKLFFIWTSSSGGDVIKKTLTDNGRREIKIAHLEPFYRKSAPIP